jgi:prohibitin 2
MGAFLFVLFLVSLIVGLGVSVAQSIKASEDHLTIKTLPTLVSVGPAFVFLGLFLGLTTVDAGYVGIVKRGGRPIAELQPGFHFIRPVGDTVQPISVQTRVTKTSEDASSKDLQIVKAEVTLAYHVDKQYALDIAVQLNDDAENRVIIPAIFESIKAETSQYDVRELVTQRAKVRDGIEERVKARLAPYHIVAESTSITNFAFSAQYEQSIEQKQVAEQNAEKAKNDLVRIQVEAQQAAAKAKGEADAAIAAATGDAQSTLIVAKAKAEAQRLQRENITPELLQLRTIELMHDKWDGVFPTTYLGSGSGSNPASLLIQPPAHTPKAAQEKQ